GPGNRDQLRFAAFEVALVEVAFAVGVGAGQRLGAGEDRPRAVGRGVLEDGRVRPVAAAAAARRRGGGDERGGARFEVADVDVWARVFVLRGERLGADEEDPVSFVDDAARGGAGVDVGVAAARPEAGRIAGGDKGGRVFCQVADVD